MADAVIAGLAGRQHRVVTRRQLLAAGVGSEAIRHRLATGRLYCLHRGVYAVGVPKVRPEGRWLAAVMACGDTAVLSHRSVAAHLKLLRPLAGPVHVIVPGSTPKRRSGIVVHATRALPRAERTTRLAVPCTTVERTIIDLAATEDWPTVERAVEQAYALRLIGRTRMRDALDRANGRKGARQLRRLINNLLDDLPYTRSELERRFPAPGPRRRPAAPRGQPPPRGPPDRPRLARDPPFLVASRKRTGASEQTATPSRARARRPERPAPAPMTSRCR